MRRPARLLFFAAAGGIALAAIGQDAPESLLPPGFNAPVRPRPAAPPPPVAGSVAPAAAPAAVPAPPSAPIDDAVPPVVPEETALPELPEPPPEMPAAARRSLDLVGAGTGYGADAFGEADGRYLSVLMRRIGTPIASRWAEILLRRMLLTSTPAPRGVRAADWAADRAALLLRLGEADGARMLVQAVDVEDFSPRLRRVAIQSALATSDPAGLCPLPMVMKICPASRSGRWCGRCARPCRAMPPPPTPRSGVASRAIRSIMHWPRRWSAPAGRGGVR